MGAVELSRAEAVALVQRIMVADGLCLRGRGERLALACPSGYVSGLVFWPPQGELSAEEVVDCALAYRPIAL
ncbi:e9imm peptide [Streptomyces xanthophaeus]